MTALFQQTFTTTLTTPVPASTNPETLLHLLHNHNFMIASQPLVTRHAFRCRQLRRFVYDVREKIDLLPFGWWKQEIRFLVAFEDKSDGVMSWVEAPLGISSWAKYTVRRARVEEIEAESELEAEVDAEAVPLTPATAKRGVIGDVQGWEGSRWVLEEEVETCCVLGCRWFVEGSMVAARRKLHERVVEAGLKG